MTEQAGQEGMTIGLKRFRDPGQLRLDRMLIQPFIGPLEVDQRTDGAA